MIIERKYKMQNNIYNKKRNGPRKVQKIPDTISEKELLEIIKNTKSKQHKLAWLLGFYQCLRISEIIKLKKEDVDVERGFLYIKQAKGSKDRHIPIVPELKHYLRHLPIKIGSRALQRALKRISVKAIGKDIHPHTLRHSGATFYLNVRKRDSRHIQQFLGHSRIETTQIYTHVNPAELKRAFEE